MLENILNGDNKSSIQDKKENITLHKSIKEYYLIEMDGEDAFDFNKEVNLLLDKGWELYGDFQIHIHDGNTFYYQTVIKL